MICIKVATVTIYSIPNVCIYSMHGGLCFVIPVQYLPYNVLLSI